MNKHTGCLLVLLYTLLVLAGCGGDGGVSTPGTRGVTAKAGLLQNVAVGNTIFLDASESVSTAGSPLTYQWILASVPQGSAAAISSPTAVNATFRADIPGQYTVKLVVTDAKSNSSEDSVTLTAVANASTPVAHAGAAQSVAVGTLVTLDGNGSSAPDDLPLTFSWTLTSRPAGSVAALSGSSTATPAFTADVAGLYAFSLVVNDGKSSSAAATVTVTALSALVLPVANAGSAKVVVVGVPVALNGSNSRSGSGAALTYNWVLTSKPSGSAAQLAGPATARPSFTPDLAGAYLLSLTVDDGVATSAAATVTVTADLLTSISIQPLDQTLQVGQSSRYIATGLFANSGSRDISTSVTWHSFDDAVATIDSTGIVTVAGTGTTVITAALLGKFASTSLTVDPSILVGIRIEKGPAITLALNQTVKLVATASYSDKTKRDVTELANWLIPNPGLDCLEVSNTPGSKGLVRSLGTVGYRVVTVSYNGMQSNIGISAK